MKGFNKSPRIPNIDGFDTKAGQYRVELEGTGEWIAIKREALEECSFVVHFQGSCW